MKVLSLYDGMACGMLALIKAEIEIESYDAFEIDKYAIQTATHNFPMIRQHGDVFNADFTKFKGVDLLCGGSPCTYWSIAQKNNRETEASGMGWELFQQYVRAVKEAEPKFFVYENNKSMSKAIRESIDNAFGFEAVLINSALVSAQNRQRLYWVGKRNEDGTYSKVDVEQPEDKGIVLKNILETGEDLTSNEKDYALTASYNGAVAWNTIERSQRNMVAEPVNLTVEGKAHCIKADYYKQGMANFITNGGHIASCVAEPVRVGCYPSPDGTIKNSQAMRIYSIEGKAVNQTAQGGGMGAKTGLYDVPACENNVVAFSPPHGWNDGLLYYEKFPNLTTGSSTRQQNVVIEPKTEKNEQITQKPQSFCNKIYEVKNGIITIKGKQYPIKLADGFYIIRKLTVKECMRLQTVPEWYEFPVSNSQAYKMLGNGWTVDVIAHIFTYLKSEHENKEIERKEVNKMELRIESFKTPEKISWNYEQLKNELIAKVAHYEAVVYDDEQIQSAKKDKAALNKLKKALNDERLRQEREYMQPFNEFKVQVNEIISIIDKPVQAIDTQVKAYEEKQKAIKKELIIGIYETLGFPSWVDFGKIFDEKWLNATTKEKAIQEALESKYLQISADLTTLASLPEFGFEATEEYKRTLDLNRAIAEGRRLAEIQKRKAEQEAAKKVEEIPVDEVDSFAVPMEQETEVTEAPTKQWLSFRALLSVEDAQALRKLFEERGVIFNAI